MTRRLSIALLVVLLSLLIVTPVLAAYYANIDVTEGSGTSYGMLPVLVSLPVDYLAEHEFIAVDGTDVRIRDSQDNDVPFMLAEDKMAFASNITANMMNRFKLTTGNTPLDSFPVIIGNGGYVTVADNVDMELGNAFDINLKGWIDTSEGSNKDIIYKQNAFRLYVNAANSIRAAILGDEDAEVVTVSAANIASGEHIIEVKADATNLKIWVDGNEKGSAALGENSVPDNTNSWILIRNNVIPCLEYLKLET